jgi:hypothetical protein
LIIAFNANPVFGFQHCLKESHHRLRCDQLPLNDRAGAFEPCRLAQSQAVPLPLDIPLHEFSLGFGIPSATGSAKSDTHLLGNLYVTDIYQ